MKWVRFKQEFEREGILHEYGGIDNLKHDPESNLWVSIKPNSNIDKCFRIYSDPDSLDAVKDKYTLPVQPPERYHPWIHYGKKDSLPKGYFYDGYLKEKSIDKEYDSKKKDFKKYFGINHPYEIFIGGWVHFYDEVIHRGETDHALYFDWNKPEESVTVYILQTKKISNWNVYVRPPSSQDPPPPKNPPPPCAQPGN
jgi:hypothetical protein